MAFMRSPVRSRSGPPTSNPPSPLELTALRRPAFHERQRHALVEFVELVRLDVQTFLGRRDVPQRQLSTLQTTPNPVNGFDIVSRDGARAERRREPLENDPGR